ncbi:peroxidase family protein [Roseofilum reptotaenium CS-1145]|nr:peroxidase family protein [Roseofilum reptotaenium]MDB9516883.1 peroxidase family protein [Roseofilum reptotaenium CS-1145]
MKLIHCLASVTLMSLGLLSNLSAQAATFRSIDGSGNNLENPTWGQTHTQLLRLLPAAYDDGISSPAGSDRPSARLVSNQLSHQSQAGGNSSSASDWFWQWGQFVDHDIDLTESHQPAEAFNVDVPVGDRWFDPFGTGVQTIRLNRSQYDPNTGTSLDNPSF